MHSLYNRIMLFFVVIIASTAAGAQVIEPASAFKTIHNSSYLRFYYDNDFFTKTDQYYTQGITVEYVHPSLKKWPVSKILIRPAGSNLQNGISYNLFGYTPTSIGSNEILYGDRPFASAMSLKFFNIASDSVRRRRISSSISIGVIGPAAQGEEVQTGIHRWLKNILPLGWQYQVRNDVIVNYQVSYEKNVADLNHAFLLNTTAEARIGTLHDKLSAGFNFMTGHFNDPFETATRSKKKIEYYFYGQGRVHAIGYDASLQGGLFNHSSPYVIPAGDLSRIVFQADAGIVFNFRKLYLCYSQSYLTREFRTGTHHRWGGISFGCTL
ncbi:MAG: lipid A deacylase LpxR family protein [Chitinophagaceae bacterium]